MKNLKKICLGLLLAFGLFGLFNIWLLPGRALAEVAPDDIPKGTDFKFIDAGHIEGTFGASGKVTFYDVNPFDSDRNFNPEAGNFCEPDGVEASDYGIQIDDNEDLNAANIPAKLRVGYPLGQDCSEKQELDITIAKGSGSTTTAYFEWSGENIITLENAENARTYTPAINGPTVGSLPSIYISDSPSTVDDVCKSDGVIELTGPNSGTYYRFKGEAWADGNVPDHLKRYLDENHCVQDGTWQVNIRGAPGTPDSQGTNTPGSTANQCNKVETCLKISEDSSACIANSHTSLEWIFCPIVTATSKFADQINNIVEGLLNFNTGEMLPENGQVNRTWTIVKNIVSGLLVILMLVMVISQAAGGQLFDAYTVKKMLPRLVIAAILMQFSWVIGVWLVEMANDLGTGIKQIIVAPFGGGGNLDLPSILNNLNPGYPAFTQLAILGILFALLLTPLSTFILPIFLFAALAMASALLIALATLVFRNVLIIMAIIFSPLALLLWATPGQIFQGYWKKYQDNFIKLLLLFPLVILVIYIGRVVAWLAGDIGAADPIDYFIVMVAFFAPYFILPKTFKWGGSILGAINQEIANNRAVKWAYGFASNRIKSEAARRSGVQGKDYDREDDYLRWERGKRWYQKGRFNPLKYSLAGRKMQGLAGGAMFDSGLSREGMLKRGEQAKHDADEANKTLVRRAEESGRAGKTGAMRLFKDPKTGKVVSQAYPAGKKRHSWTAGWAQARRLLGRGNWRQGEKAAEEIFSDPAFAVFHEDMLELDPNESVRKAYDSWSRQRGLRGRYNADDPSKADRDLHSEIEALELKGDARTPEENKELDRLKLFKNYRQSGGPARLTRQDRKYQKDLLEFMEKVYPKALAPIAGVEDLEARAVKFTDLEPVQKKATSSSQMKQALSAMDPLSNPDVVAKMSDRDVPAGQPGFGGKLQVSNNPDDLPDQGKFNESDTDNYGWKEQVAGSSVGTAHERFWADRAEVDSERLKNLEYPLQSIDNMGEPTLAWGIPGAKWFKDAFDLKDGQAAGLLAHIIRIPSTRQYFNEWLAGGLPTPDHMRAIVEDAESRPAFKPQAINNMHTMYELRRSMGIDDDDARELEDRDWRILSETLQRQVYDPTWTAKDTRYIFDLSSDPGGAKAKVGPDWGDDWTPPPEYIPPEPRSLANMSAAEYEALPEDAKASIQKASYRTGFTPRPGPGGDDDGSDTTGGGSSRPSGPSSGPDSGSGTRVRSPQRPGGGMSGLDEFSGPAGGSSRARREEFPAERSELPAGSRSETSAGARSNQTANTNSDEARQLKTLLAAQREALRKGATAELKKLDSQIKSLMPEPPELSLEEVTQAAEALGIPSGAVTPPTQSVPAQSAAAPAAPAPPAVVVAAPAPSFTPPVSPAPNVTQVVNQTTVVKAPSAQAPAQGVSVRGGPTEGSSGNLHPYATERPGAAETNWGRQQRMESEMRHAFADALRPVAEQVRKSAQTNVDAGSVADNAARRISRGGGPR